MNITELLNSKYSIYIITAVLFISLALILRFLYGPKGIFRDPYWDKSNEEIRQKEKEKGKE